MLYILMVVVISSFVPTTLKFARIRSLNTDYVIFFNYLIAAVFSGVKALRSGMVSGIPLIAESDIRELFYNITIPNTYLLILIVGIVSGALYYAALILVKMSVVENGMGKTSMFSRLSFLVSLVAAVLIWHEIPSVVSGLGILFGIASVILLLKDSEKRQGNTILLILLMLVNGLVEVGNKLITMYSISTRYKDLFVAVVYIVAFFFCSAVLVASQNKNRSERASMKEVGLGVVLGIPNVANSLLILKALEALPAAIAFASIASGSVLLSSIIGSVVFHEQIKKNQKIAIVITVCGLALMNLG